MSLKNCRVRQQQACMHQPGINPMKDRRADTFELLAFGAAEAAALLILVSQAGKIATLLWAVVLPLAAWFYAHFRARDRIGTIVGVACGLAAFPVSHGLFSLIVLPFPLQLVGVLGLIGEALHGFPGNNLVATFAKLQPHPDTGIAVLLVDYLFNGLVWAAIYGLIGYYVDRLRNNGSEAPS